MSAAGNDVLRIAAADRALEFELMAAEARRAGRTDDEQYWRGQADKLMAFAQTGEPIKAASP